MPVSIWSNVQVAVQSALGTANTISGVTKANPAVATYTGANPANGDYIVVTQAATAGDHVFVKESNVIAIIKGEV